MKYLKQLQLLISSVSKIFIEIEKEKIHFNSYLTL